MPSNTAALAASPTRGRGWRATGASGQVSGTWLVATGEGDRGDHDDITGTRIRRGCVHPSPGSLGGGADFAAAYAAAGNNRRERVLVSQRRAGVVRWQRLLSRRRGHTL